ncbi:hypothetical protein GOODEAATRI_000172 [Goodea atripinnis]|uniref:Uncharacterized protein n=1 Tax=Goodea atripinnis TaxID=208336 RepID=A0ABV0MYZ5_9TELE
MRQAENHTDVVLRASYQKIADPAAGSVGELFTDVGLFLLGSELNVDEFVQRFFDALLPLVYSHYINPGVSDTSPGYAECVRSLNRIIKPFGVVPGLLADQIATSGVSGKLLLQALHLGIEVINTTDHLQLSRECRRALLKMQYCPHCQDTNSRVSIPLKALNRRSEDSLSVMRKDFLKTLRTFSTFYGGLADQMCLQELSSGDGVPCWNGTNIVKRFVSK